MLSDQLSVPEQFVTRAAHFHCHGRLGMLLITAVTLTIAAVKCWVGWGIVGCALIWYLITWFWLCGARFTKRPPNDYASLNPADHFCVVHSRRFQDYPWFTFIPDLILLTVLVLHTGGAYSPFAPMFLVLGTLGDYALISWRRRKLFLPLFIGVPYLLVVWIDTALGHQLVQTYAPWLLGEPAWLGSTALDWRLFTSLAILYLGATWFGSFVMRHLGRLALANASTTTK